MNKYSDLIGKKFGMLLVVSKIIKHDTVGNRVIYWSCMCDCGNIREVKTQQLIHNITYSCGCKLYIGVHKNKKYSEEEASYRAKISTYKAQAKSRKIEWTLEYNDAIKMIKSNCHYCGREPNNGFNLYNGRRIHQWNKDKYQIKCNGIDRIDSNLGYTKSNTLPCCTICNFGKNNLTYNEFILWINDLIKFRTK